ncbi:DUF5071 domain-containing protein [Paenisporosarcina indica]|uniref:DUF5071 domain-containing protein n=1 Tax=Paenisporosarcina indica TaxID=650093 RepID=UPI00094FEAC7|nr:DUF5071 domain-containing protein [Paenisporosarcina indica]
MENFEDQLPRDKFDEDRVELIKKMDRAQILPLLPGLLVWTQDMNWPVAPGIVELLLTFPEEIVPHVKDVLKSDDHNWKWYILHFLVTELPLESRMQFKEYLNRVAEAPSKSETDEELDEIAVKILNSI